MRGKRAKALRKEASELSENAWTWYETIKHRPVPVRDGWGRLIGQVDCYTHRCAGLRRAYQDLKKQRRAERTAETPKLEKNR